MGHPWCIICKNKMSSEYPRFFTGKGQRTLCAENHQQLETTITLWDSVAYPLSIIVNQPLCIVNQSFCTGIFPHRLKLGKVIRLYKKDDNKLLVNYRPISLLSSLSKVFEKIVFDQSYDYLIINGLLFESCTVEMWEWTSNFIPHFTMNVIIFPSCNKVKAC